MTIAAILANKGSEVATIARERHGRATRSRCSAKRRIGALPVVDGGEIAGIMSERDVIYCLREHGAEVLDWPVEPGDERRRRSRSIRRPPVLTALAMMTQQRIRHLPVVEGGQTGGNRLDRRPGEAPHRADRGRSRGDAGLYPVGLTHLEIGGFPRLLRKDALGSEIFSK